MSELVSVIIPVYNVKPYLVRCLLSIVGQTCGNLEILVIDDGSTDGSSETCDRVASEDDRIIFIEWSMKPLFLELQNLSIVMKRMNIILFVMDRFNDGACFKADYASCRHAPFLFLVSN